MLGVSRFAREFESIGFQEGVHEIFQCGDALSLSTLFGHLAVPWRCEHIQNGVKYSHHRVGQHK